MNEYYVYQLRLARARNPFYIGKGKGNRAYTHTMPAALRDNSIKANTIRKALREGRKIHVEILMTSLTHDEAIAWECWYIKAHGRRNIGTGCLANLTDGGDGIAGHKHTAAAKEALRLANIGKTLSEETRAKMRARRHSAETRAKMSASRTGQVFTEERCAAISLAKMGHVHSEEARAAMKAAWVLRRKRGMPANQPYPKS